VWTLLHSMDMQAHHRSWRAIETSTNIRWIIGQVEQGAGWHDDPLAVEHDMTM
jgi:hypothetical protein